MYVESLLRIAIQDQDAPYPQLSARVAKATGESFNGLILEVTPPLKKHQVEAAQKLGATVLPNTVEGNLTTTVLLSDLQIMDARPGIHSAEAFATDFLSSVHIG